MKSLHLKTIIRKINGKVLQGADDIEINNIVTRAKRLESRTMLLDIYHDKVDAQYLKRKRFPCAVITDRSDDFIGAGQNISIISVKDINKAYWSFAEYYRSLFNIPIIGVTGTCGKTTTKEMIKHILSSYYNVNATYKSYNASFRNFGYLLDIDDNTEAAVIEMGVASPKDLSISCRYFKPQVGVITNIGVDHLQAFGTLDAYINGKAELLEGLGLKGTLVLNADDENIKKIDLKKYKGRVIYFGFSENSDFRASNLIHENGGIRFLLQHKDQSYNIFISGYAEFNAYNAIAAIAAAHAVGFDVKEAVARLGSFNNIEKHFEFHNGINGAVVIDDTWSTNPTSAEAALKLVKNFSQGKKTIAALGRMSLLGKESSKYHYLIGQKVADIGIDQLIIIGDGAREIGLGALHKGMKQDSVFFCNNFDEIYKVLKSALGENTVLLVKTTMLGLYTDLIDRIIEKNN